MNYTVIQTRICPHCKTSNSKIITKAGFEIISQTCKEILEYKTKTYLFGLIKIKKPVYCNFMGLYSSSYEHEDIWIYTCRAIPIMESGNLEEC